MLVVFVTAWVGIRALQAKTELESAMSLVAQAKDDFEQGNTGSVQGTVEEVAARTASARELTSDPVWRVAEFVPVLGANLTGFRELAGITDQVAQGVGLPISAIAGSLDVAALKPQAGRIDLAPFDDVGIVLDDAGVVLDDALARVQSLDTSGAIAPIQDAHAELEGLLEPLAPSINQAADLLTALPGLLGADGPRTYLIVFQNNAEARALGGHAGSWVQINADAGTLTLARQESVGILRTPTPVIPLTYEQIILFPGAGSDPSNVTIVPRLELSAQTASAFWNNRFGVQPNSVLFIDPVAIGYLLAATGPIELPSGDVIDSGNASQFLLSGVYLKYATNEEQDAVFGAFVQAMFGKLMGGEFEPATLLSAGLRAGDEKRILTWFFDETEREQLSSLSSSLATPVHDDETVGFGLYVTDNLGSKMTYFLDAKVELGQQVCAGEGRYQVRATFTNRVTADEGAALPWYIGREQGGLLRILVTLYAPPGSSFVEATGWDPTFTPVQATEGEYPAMVQRLDLAPGQSTTTTFVMSAPDVDLDRELEAYVTPLARPIPVTGFEYSC